MNLIAFGLEGDLMDGGEDMPNRLMLILGKLISILGKLMSLFYKPKQFKHDIQVEGLFLVSGCSYDRVRIHRFFSGEGFSSLWIKALDSKWVGRGFLDENTMHYLGVFHYLSPGGSLKNVMGIHHITFAPGTVYVRGHNAFAPTCGVMGLPREHFAYDLEHVE